MSAKQLLGAGLACCMVALAIQLFPMLAFEIGVDVAASWRLLGFGVFLIAAATLITSSCGRAPH